MKSFKALVAEETLEGDFGFSGKWFANRFYQGRCVAVIDQGVNVGKPVCGYELFGVKTSIRLAELGVSFLGNASL